MKAMLLNAGQDMTSVPDYPTDTEGWGLLRLDDVLYFAGEERRLVVRDRRHADGLADAEAYSFEVTVTDSSEPLRITLVFNDPPAAPGVSEPVVNDLDLLIIDPIGDFCFGNTFENGQSVPAGFPDEVNNVEQFLLQTPAPGVYTVTVTGTLVRSVNPFDPDQPLGRQGFAVVASGAILDGRFDLEPGFADADFDGDRDLADFAAMQRCVNVPVPPNSSNAPCALFDADASGMVDATDLPPFEAVYSGPEVAEQF
jgi:hypothetical protein